MPNDVRYSFSSEDNNGYFDINPDTGWITVAKPMDREDPWVLQKFGVLDMEILTEEVTDDPKVIKKFLCESFCTS